MRKLALVLGLFLCCAVGRAQYIQPKVVGGSGGGGGTGTVTSVTSANARATVANSTTTPVITIVSAPIADSVINQAILLAGKQNAGTYLGPGDTTNLHNLAAGAVPKGDSVAGVRYITQKKLNDTATAIRSSIGSGLAPTTFLGDSIHLDRKGSSTDSAALVYEGGTFYLRPADSGSASLSNFEFNSGHSSSANLFLSSSNSFTDGFSSYIATYGNGRVRPGQVDITSLIQVESEGGDSLTTLNWLVKNNDAVGLTTNVLHVGPDGFIAIGSNSAFAPLDIAPNTSFRGDVAITGAISGNGSGLTNLPSDVSKVNVADVGTVYLAPNGDGSALTNLPSDPLKVNVADAGTVYLAPNGDGSGLTNLPSDANKVNYTDSNTIYVTPTGLNNAIPAVSKVLFDRFADTSNSGTSETIAYRSTITYNGDDLFFSDPGAKLNVQFSGTVVGSATASKRFRVYINTDTSGGALIYDSGAITMSSSSSWILDATAFTGMASGATNGFKTSGALNSNGLAVGSDTYSGTPTSPDYNPGDPIAVTLTITETGTGSGSNHITASTGTATLIPGANPNH